MAKKIDEFSNAQIANILFELATTLEIEKDNPYRIKAYRKAARTIEKLSYALSPLVKNNQSLQTLEGIGPALEAKIREIILNEGVVKPFTFKPPEYKPESTRHRSHQAKIYDLNPIVKDFLEKLKQLPEVKECEVAGSYRRKKEVIDKIVILLASTNPKKTFTTVLTFPGIQSYSSLEKDFLQMRLKIGISLTLYNVDKKRFAKRLFELTGSEAHVSKLAIDSSAHITDEVSIYKELGLEFIPPELREDRGEIEAALLHQLPNLITIEDIKGDLHSHTEATDGSYPLIDMVKAAQAKGYQYVGITDHTKSLKITNGLDEKRIRKQMEEIDKLNSTLKNFKILKSSEVDILADGSLDLPDSVLKELDLTVCSIHSKFKLPYEQQTDRILRAMDNPYLNILGHATGRLINHRAPYAIDIEKVLYAAKERNCHIEVNSQPARLDINDSYCKLAKELGVKVSIASDAHTTRGFDFMILGVNQARRGWLEPSDVINTYSLAKLRKILKRK
jgi:DNA polymerase (family 10)